MALHATIIVPDGTTDEQLARVRQIALVAIMDRLADLKSRASNPESINRDYWRGQYNEAKAAFRILRAAGCTSLNP